MSLSVGSLRDGKLILTFLRHRVEGKSIWTQTPFAKPYSSIYKNWWGSGHRPLTGRGNSNPFFPWPSKLVNHYIGYYQKLKERFLLNLTTLYSNDRKREKVYQNYLSNLFLLNYTFIIKVSYHKQMYEDKQNKFLWHIQ